MSVTTSINSNSLFNSRADTIKINYINMDDPTSYTRDIYYLPDNISTLLENEQKDVTNLIRSCACLFTIILLLTLSYFIDPNKRKK